MADHVRVTTPADAVSSGREWAPEKRPSKLGFGSGLQSVRNEIGRWAWLDS